MYSSDEFDFVDLIEAGAGECLEEAKDSSLGIASSLPIPPTRTPKKIGIVEEGELSPLEDFYSLANAASDDEDAQYFLGMFKEQQVTEQVPQSISSNKGGKGGKRWFPSKLHK